MKKLFIIILCLILFIGCKKEKDELSVRIEVTADSDILKAKFIHSEIIDWTIQKEQFTKTVIVYKGTPCQLEIFEGQNINVVVRINERIVAEKTGNDYLKITFKAE